jgi:hypothetical protein
MKKVILMLSIALVGLTSCGSGTEAEAPKADTTVVAPVSSTVEVVADTVVAPADTTKK